MNKKLKKTLFTILPIGLGVFIIGYFLSELTIEDRVDITNSFKTANYWWVALSLFFGILSHLSRAYRWKFMIEPLGYKPKFPNLVMTVLIAYLVNLILPRAGEVARATAFSKYENVPFEKGFGTIVAERIADIIMLLAIISLAFVLQGDLIKSSLIKEEGDSYNSQIIFGSLGLMVVIGYFILKKSKHPFVLKVKAFISGLIEGVKSIFKMKSKWAFIFHTIFIWLMYVLMFYATTFALPETTHLPFGAIIVGFVVGGLSMALTNGGLGVYPVAVAGVLVLYGVESNPANAFGWIMWTAQTLMILLFGGLSFLFLPLYNKEK
ncbi:MAG: flippase-like domain-containing protein [Urechidicola sp.]|nr:flippase-like domain-containing protein [Urechidicola sp.]